MAFTYRGKPAKLKEERDGEGVPLEVHVDGDKWPGDVNIAISDGEAGDRGPRHIDKDWDQFVFGPWDGYTIQLYTYEVKVGSMSYVMS